MLTSVPLAQAQPEPENGPPSNPTRVHAVVNAKVVIAPGQTQDDATVIVRDGVIEAVVPAVDPETRTALVRIRPLEDSLSAGEAVEVQLPVSWRGVGVTVPRDALLLDPQASRVLAVSDGAARSVVVEVLATTDALALVIGDGLSAGDEVITRGNERVRDGQAVRIEGQGQ